MRSCDHVGHPIKTLDARKHVCSNCGTPVDPVEVLAANMTYWRERDPEHYEKLERLAAA